MRTAEASPNTIDEYIAGSPPDVQELLQKLRATIQAAAPRAEEAIKYRMPTFTQEGNLVHFAAFQHHIGLYPAPTGIEAFREELAAYAGGKGSLRFPLGQPIPFELIGRVVRFRVQENLERAAARRKKK